MCAGEACRRSHIWIFRGGATKPARKRGRDLGDESLIQGTGRWRLAAALVGLLLATEALFGLASFARAPLTIDIGPSTGAYLAGFSDSEERLPVTFRWTGERAVIAPPVTVAPGPGALVIRYARFVDETVRVRVYVSGTQAGSFLARPGRFRTQRVPMTLPSGPLQISLLSETAEPRRLGIAVDWIRIEQGRSQKSEVPRIGRHIDGCDRANQTVEEVGGRSFEDRSALARLSLSVDDVEAVLPTTHELSDELGRIL